MKSPIYLLTVLLPLASALAAAPPADPDPDDFDSVQEFQEFEERDLDDRQFKGPCRVNKPYFYWKYPCDSSDRIGRQNVGGQFTATCSYRNWYKTNKGWVHNFDKPKNCQGNWNKKC